MGNFNIRKSYDGFPSKTNNDYETHATEAEAQQALNYIAERWVRNGGIVVSQTENELTVEEGDGSQTITFEVFERYFND